MLDTEKILEAIDAFTQTEPEESYQIHIPSQKGKLRNYLGLSGIGEECPRNLWYQWRQVFTEPIMPRMRRLWRRGDREEYAFVFLLRGIGFTIFEVDADGKQFKVTDFNGHLSGHSDGVGKAPLNFWIKSHKPVPFLLEFKTYNKNRFGTLRSKGVAKSDPKYYVQMQGYMGYENLTGALFCAVCKDDDHLYFEWVPFKKSAFQAKVLDRAEDTITSMVPPDRIANSISDFRCKWCKAKEVCFKGAPAIKSCRSCKFAEPAENASWVCKKGGEYGTLCAKYKDITK